MWLKSLFSRPKPAGPPQVLRAFSPANSTITQAGIRVDQDGWRIDATGQTISQVAQAETI